MPDDPRRGPEEADRLALLLIGFPPAEAAAVAERLERDGLSPRLEGVRAGEAPAALREPFHAALLYGDGADGTLAATGREAPGMPVVAVLPAGVAPPDPEPEDWLEHRYLRRLGQVLREAIARERRHRLFALIRGLTHELSNFLAPGQLVLDLATVGGRPDVADWAAVHEGISRSLDMSRWIARLAAAPLSGRLPVPAGPLLRGVAADLRERPEPPLVITDYPRGMPALTADPVLAHRVAWCLALGLLDGAGAGAALRLASRVEDEHLVLEVTRDGEGASVARPSSQLAGATAAAGGSLSGIAGGYSLRFRVDPDRHPSD